MGQRQHARHASHLAVEVELANHDVVAFLMVGQIGQVARGLEHDDGQRQVEPRAVLRHVGRREVDEDFDLRVGDARGPKRAADPIERLADGALGHAADLHGLAPR